MDKKYLVEKWQEYLPPQQTKNIGVLYKVCKVFENTTLENLDRNTCKILFAILYKVFSQNIEFELSKSTKNKILIGSFPAGEILDHNAIMIDLAIPHINTASKNMSEKISSGEITKICSLNVQNNKKDYNVYVSF
jgi:hypothetical protein